jgi:hypothetical protein
LFAQKIAKWKTGFYKGNQNWGFKNVRRKKMVVDDPSYEVM